MKMNGFLIAGVVSLILPNLCSAQTAKDMGEIFEKRCSNCHGAKAQGVPKLKEKSGVKVDVADHKGVASEEQTNIYGPPLIYMTKDELINKLVDLRAKGFDATSYHSVMRENLKIIEQREGEISDEKMAEYITSHFAQ